MEIITSLSENPYFGAGFGLFGVGALAASGRKLSKFALAIFKRNFVTSLEVPCNDKCYSWVLDWITKRGAAKSQHLSVRTFYDETEWGKVDTQYHLLPALGIHFFRHPRTRTWIKMERTREQHQQDIIGGTPWETVTLMTLGNKRQLFLDLIREAREDALAMKEGKTLTYTYMNNEWRQYGKAKEKRPLQSVVLDKDVSEKILFDIQRFIDSKEWYRQKGVPYRRGYLLYGPPGCGKTSFIFSLAGHLDFSICVLNLSDPNLTDEGLSLRLADTPENSLILLEDVDAAFLSRNQDKTQSSAFQGMNRLTFSGLLNALDGVASSDMRILFMTTNYVEKLDDALIRPGRIDFKQNINYCTQAQAMTLYNNFYPESSENDKEYFSSAFSLYNEPVSPAKLQGLFLKYPYHKDLTQEIKGNSVRLINVL